MTANEQLHQGALDAAQRQLNDETTRNTTIREIQIAPCVDSFRASCTECVWSDSGNPEAQARAHVGAFGHDVMLSHVVVTSYTLRPAAKGAK